MTDAEWLSGSLTPAVVDEVLDRLSGRKARLLLCACCRSLLFILPDWAERFVELAEAYADSEASEEEARSADRALQAHVTQVRKLDWEPRTALQLGARALPALLLRGDDLHAALSHALDFIR